MNIVLENDALKVIELINSKDVVLNELKSSLDFAQVWKVISLCP